MNTTKPNPEVAWFVVDPGLRIVLWSFGMTRAEAITAFCGGESIDETWGIYKQNGYIAVKCQVTPIDEACAK